MSWFSKLTGQDARRNRAATRSAQQWGQGNDPGDQIRKAILSEQQGGGWEKAFNETAGSYVNQMLPDLRNKIGLSKEDSIRRGISTGDLGTSNQGDVVTAWGQNVSNTLGGMAMQGYENNQNRYLDLLTGTIDRNQSNKNAQNNMWAGLADSIFSAAGSAFGGGHL